MKRLNIFIKVYLQSVRINFDNIIITFDDVITLTVLLKKLRIGNSTTKKSRLSSIPKCFQRGGRGKFAIEVKSSV